MGPDQEKELFQKQKDTVNSYKKVFGTPEGDLVLKDLMTKYGVITGTYDESPNAMYFKEGQRSVVFDILANINLDYKDFKEKYEEINNPF